MEHVLPRQGGSVRKRKVETGASEVNSQPSDEARGRLTEIWAWLELQALISVGYFLTTRCLSPLHFVPQLGFKNLKAASPASIGCQALP
jgi:hypothetical protein